MTGERDEDALFDRLAKSLEAVRQDAELARSGGAEGLSAALARAEDELRSVVGGLEALRQRFEQQNAVTTRLEAATAKNESDLQGLRQTVEALSQRAREQAEMLAKPSTRRPVRAAALVVVALVVLVLAGGAAAWIASGRQPTVGALAHRFVVRLSELTGINLAGWDGPARSTQTVAQAAPSAEPAAQPQAAAAPEPAASAAPAPASSPPAAAIAQTQTPATAPPPLAEAPAAAPAPVEPPAAAAPPQATAAPPPAQTAAGTPPAPVAPAAPAVPSPVTQSETPAPAVTALAQPPHPPQAARQLILRATADSWVEVRRKGGRVLFARVMKAGETWPVPAESDLLLDSGNAGALELEVNGVPTKLPGARPGVVHDVPLETDVR